MNLPSSTEVCRDQTPLRQLWWVRLEERWNIIQVGRQGAYSVERLESFDHYCKTTSRARVFLVCVLTPLPALSVAIILECLPLRPPSEGWAANWLFWVRLTFECFIMIFAGASQLVTLVPDLNPTFLKRQLVAWGATAALTATFLLGAHVIGFPIPFQTYIGGIFVGAYAPAAMTLVFGKRILAANSPCFHNLQQFLLYFSAFMTLCNIFPLCKVLYGFVPVAYQGVVVFVLPIWKLAAKRFMVRFIRPLEDFLPGIVAVTVDFFSALFTSVCMSTTGSNYLSPLFIAVDIGQSLLEYREVRTNANVVSELLRRRHRSSERFKVNSLKRRSLSGNSTNSDLVAVALEVVRDPAAFNITSMEGVRLRACFPHRTTEDQEARLQVLGASTIYAQPDFSSLKKKTSRYRPPNRWWLPNRRVYVEKATIVPEYNSVVSACMPQVGEAVEGCEVEMSQVDLNHIAVSGTRSKKLALQALQLLFHCEYLILVEYIECIVPIVYVTYKSALEQLPNVVYYPGGGGQFGIAPAVNILVFAILEIISLLVLHTFLERKFAYSPLYQLAFVLETQIYVIQPKFFIIVMLLLHQELQHYGADFTFHFQWLHGET